TAARFKCPRRSAAVAAAGIVPASQDAGESNQARRWPRGRLVGRGIRFWRAAVLGAIHADAAQAQVQIVRGRQRLREQQLRKRRRMWGRMRRRMRKLSESPRDRVGLAWRDELAV